MWRFKRSAIDVLPIVAMTANAMKADRDRCMEAGMNDFVTQPIRPDDLWETLLTWIGQREGLGPVIKALPATNTHAETPPPLQELRRVAGLDVDLGLSRTNDNPTLSASRLSKFVLLQESALQCIEQALRDGDRTCAERHAHTLKGVAGKLGAEPLQQAAEALEACLRTGASAGDIAVASSPPPGCAIRYCGDLSPRARRTQTTA